METSYQPWFMQELVPCRDTFSATPRAVPSGDSCALVLIHTGVWAEAMPAPCCSHCGAAATLRTALSMLSQKLASKYPKSTDMSFQAPLPDILFRALTQPSFLINFKTTFL